MKIDLIGMILNNLTRDVFDGAVTSNADGKPLNSLRSLDALITEYAKARNGGESDLVELPRSIREATAAALSAKPRTPSEQTLTDMVKDWANQHATSIQTVTVTTKFGERSHIVCMKRAPEANNG